MYSCKYQNCSKKYNSRSGYINHLTKIHQETPPFNIPNISPNTPQNPHNDQLYKNHNDLKKAEQDGFNRDELEIALELSLKEQYKEFIPDDDTLNSLSSKNDCILCYSQKADVAFVDCGHMIVCSDCGKKLDKKKCPICRRKILKLLKIYTS